MKRYSSASFLVAPRLVVRTKADYSSICRQVSRSIHAQKRLLSARTNSVEQWVVEILRDCIHQHYFVAPLTLSQ